MLGYTHDEVFFFFGRKYLICTNNYNYFNKDEKWFIKFPAPIGIANTINWAKKYLQNAAKENKDIGEEPKALLARVVNDLVKAGFKQAKKVNNLYLFVYSS